MNANHLIQLKSPNLKHVLLVAVALNIAAGASLALWDVLRTASSNADPAAKPPFAESLVVDPAVMPYVEPLGAP